MSANIYAAHHHVKPNERDYLREEKRDEARWINSACILHSKRALDDFQSDGGCLNIYRVHQ